MTRRRARPPPPRDRDGRRTAERHLGCGSGATGTVGDGDGPDAERPGAAGRGGGGVSRPASSAATLTWSGAETTRRRAAGHAHRTGRGGQDPAGGGGGRAAGPVVSPGSPARSRSPRSPRCRSRPRCRTRSSTRSACASGRCQAGRGRGGRPLDRLCAALAERNALLILDNCEHVIEPAALLTARLLADCPGVRVLATSREPLRIGGESLYVVAPLPVPPPSTRPRPRLRRRVRWLDGGRPGLIAGRAAVRRPGRRRAARLPGRPDAEHGRTGGADLPDARRHAAGDRAGGTVAPHADPGPAWPSGSMTGSRCSPAAAGPRCPGTRRCARPSTGAGSCYRGPSGCSPAAWPSSPAAPR